MHIDLNKVQYMYGVKKSCGHSWHNLSCKCCRDVLYVIDNIIKASFATDDGFRASLNLFTEIAKVCIS